MLRRPSAGAEGPRAVRGGGARLAAPGAAGACSACGVEKRRIPCLRLLFYFYFRSTEARAGALLRATASLLLFAPESDFGAFSLQRFQPFPSLDLCVPSLDCREAPTGHASPQGPSGVRGGGAGRRPRSPPRLLACAGAHRTNCVRRQTRPHNRGD